MNKAQFYFISKVYYLTQLINFIFVLGSDQNSVFIDYKKVFIGLIFIDRLIILLVIYKHRKGIWFYIFWFMDHCSLGFLIKFKLIKDGIQQIIRFKAISYLYPMILLQSCFNFDKLVEQNFGLYLILYINYIVQIILISLYYYPFYTKKNQIFLNCISHLAYYCSIRYMISSQDLFGFNLGYYSLFIALTNIIIIQQSLSFKRCYVFDVIFFSILCNSMNYSCYLNSKCQNVLRDDQVLYLSKKLSYFNQLSRTIIILIFMNVNKNLMPQQTNRVYQLNQIFTIVFSIIFLIICSKKIWLLLFKKQFILIKNQADYIKITQYLSLHHPHLIYIKIYFQTKSIKCGNWQEEVDIQTPLNSTQECIYYNYQKNISNQLKLKQLIIENTKFYKFRCECKVEKLYEEEEFISQSEEQEMRNFDFKQLLFARFKNGLIFTDLTKRIENRIDKSSDVQLSLFWKSHILQLIVTIKIMYPLMTIQPQEISYDIYS